MKTGDYETVYKDWEKRLSKEASENWLIALKKSISKWQKTADMMDKKLVNEGHLFDVFEDFEIRKDIEQRRALVKQLKSLCERYSVRKQQVKPAQKKDWIKEEYNKSRSNFETDDDWALSTAKKFKERFKTDVGDAVSMKRYGKYKGLN